MDPILDPMGSVLRRTRRYGGRQTSAVSGRFPYRAVPGNTPTHRATRISNPQVAGSSPAGDATLKLSMTQLTVGHRILGS